jgi:hypothetical protein
LGGEIAVSVADVGGLMYYGADLADSYRLVAWYVHRILKGSMLSGAALFR